MGKLISWCHWPEQRHAVLTLVCVRARARVCVCVYVTLQAHAGSAVFDAYQAGSLCMRIESDGRSHVASAQGTDSWKQQSPRRGGARDVRPLKACSQGWQLCRIAELLWIQAASLASEVSATGKLVCRCIGRAVQGRLAWHCDRVLAVCVCLCV